MTARECYTRCGRTRVRPSAYCPQCSADIATRNQQTGRARLPAGTARCPACRNVFAAEVYDHHRHNGVCLDPAAARLIAADGVWTTPAPADTP